MKTSFIETVFYIFLDKLCLGPSLVMKLSKCIVALVVSYFLDHRRMFLMSGVCTLGHIINGGKFSMVERI